MINIALDSMVVNEQDANRHLHLLLKVMFPLTKVVDAIHPLPDVFDVARIYTCSIKVSLSSSMAGSLQFIYDRSRSLQGWFREIWQRAILNQARP
jgi:hypothetical protein